VISKSFGHQQCHYLAAIDDQGEWQGVLPLVHMRSKVFGNFMYRFLLSITVASSALMKWPLNSCSTRPNSFGILLATHIELRHLGRNLPGMSTKQHKVTKILELAADADNQWRAFNAKLRNQIR
jgi:hypothetical protein